MTDPHQYFDDPAVTRLMGMVVALAGEVFVLKALNERLTRVLLATGTVTAAQLEEIAASRELEQWMAEEKLQFARFLLEPIRNPDVAQRMHDELFGGEGQGQHVATG